jgi:hypothetical protein
MGSVDGGGNSGRWAGKLGQRQGGSLSWAVGQGSLDSGTQLAGAAPSSLRFPADAAGAAA